MPSGAVQPGMGVRGAGGRRRCLARCCAASANLSSVNLMATQPWRGGLLAHIADTRGARGTGARFARSFLLQVRPFEVLDARDIGQLPARGLEHLVPERLRQPKALLERQGA